MKTPSPRAESSIFLGRGALAGGRWRFWSLRAVAVVAAAVPAPPPAAPAPDPPSPATAMTGGGAGGGAVVPHACLTLRTNVQSPVSLSAAAASLPLQNSSAISASHGRSSGQSSISASALRALSRFSKSAYILRCMATRASMMARSASVSGRSSRAWKRLSVLFGVEEEGRVGGGSSFFFSVTGGATSRFWGKISIGMESCFDKFLLPRKRFFSLSFECKQELGLSLKGEAEREKAGAAEGENRKKEAGKKTATVASRGRRRRQQRGRRRRR